MRILVVDVGGTHVKLLATGHRRPVRFVSGPTLTPAEMVANARVATRAWVYDVVSIGYPGPVVDGRPAGEPHNLAPGWIGFDFATAFERPVHVVNDAAMQALGGYRGGRTLFLGLGTGLGSALVVEGHLQPLELAHLPYRKGRTFEEYVGEAGLERLGKRRWRRRVVDVVERLKAALQAEFVLLGGGNARRMERWLDRLPAGTRLGSNADAFRGGMRLWHPPEVRAQVT
jgi:polyphosphate glucokinase